MKLDKIRFAMLIAYICQIGASVGANNVEHIDKIIDIEGEVKTVGTSPDRLNDLLLLMQEGNRKIEAIKAYRDLTGCGLIESKDAVEKYWPSPVKDKTKEMLNDMLNVIDATLTGNTTILSNLPSAELSEVKRFVNTYIINRH